jgi:predicted transcriptional regulator
MTDLIERLTYRDVAKAIDHSLLGATSGWRRQWRHCSACPRS